jgi:sulfur relay (sulfurtransferase) DsrC/TusE family protein
VSFKLGAQSQQLFAIGNERLFAIALGVAKHNTGNARSAAETKSATHWNDRTNPHIARSACMTKRSKRWMTVVYHLREFWESRTVVDPHFQMQRQSHSQRIKPWP